MVQFSHLIPIGVNEACPEGPLRNEPVKCGWCGLTIKPTNEQGLWLSTCPRCGAAVGGGGNGK